MDFVLKEQDPSVQVEGSLTEGSGGGNFGHLSVLLQITVISLGGIFGNIVNHDTRSKRNNGRDNTDGSPCLFGITVKENVLELMMLFSLAE
jgi:hypothetical protein